MFALFLVFWHRLRLRRVATLKLRRSATFKEPCIRQRAQLSYFLSLIGSLMHKLFVSELYKSFKCGSGRGGNGWPSFSTNFHGMMVGARLIHFATLRFYAGAVTNLSLAVRRVKCEAQVPY